MKRPNTAAAPSCAPEPLTPNFIEAAAFTPIDELRLLRINQGLRDHIAHLERTVGLLKKTLSETPSIFGANFQPRQARKGKK